MSATACLGGRPGLGATCGPAVIPGRRPARGAPLDLSRVAVESPHSLMISLTPSPASDSPSRTQATARISLSLYLDHENAALTGGRLASRTVTACQRAPSDSGNEFHVFNLT